MAGRTGDYIPEKQAWSNVVYMPCTAETNFAPELPKETPDIIYLCFPNNPTGSTITKDELQKWVDYANKVGAVIIYDAAYEAYLDSLDKYVMDSIYKKVKNGIASEFEKNAMSKYYEVTSLKESEYIEYKYRKQKYLIELDYEGIKVGSLKAKDMIVSSGLLFLLFLDFHFYIK